jgi:hypothetical protein
MKRSKDPDMIEALAKGWRNLSHSSQPPDEFANLIKKDQAKYSAI